MQCLDIVDRYAHLGARARIAMVLRQVQPAVVARDLHVEGSVRPEAVLEIDREAEKIHVKLARLGLVEYAQDGCHRS